MDWIYGHLDALLVRASRDKHIKHHFTTKIRWQMDLGWMAFIAVTFKTLSKCHHLPVVPGAIFPAGSLKRVALFGWYFWGGSFFWVTFWMKDLARTFLNGPSNLRPKESDFELVNVSLEISRTFCRSFLPG